MQMIKDYVIKFLERKHLRKSSCVINRYSLTDCAWAVFHGDIYAKTMAGNTLAQYINGITTALSNLDKMEEVELQNEEVDRAIASAEKDIVWLNKKGYDVTFGKSQRNEGTDLYDLSFKTIDDVVISHTDKKKYNFGKFRIFVTLDPNGGKVHVVTHAPIENNKTAQDGAYYHPHMGRVSICTGETAREMIRQCMEPEVIDIIGVVEIITNMLNTYNPDSPFAHIGSWSATYKCADCDADIEIHESHKGLRRGKRYCSDCLVVDTHGRKVVPDSVVKSNTHGGWINSSFAVYSKCMKDYLYRLSVVPTVTKTDYILPSWEKCVKVTYDEDANNYKIAQGDDPVAGFCSANWLKSKYNKEVSNVEVAN